MNLSGRDLTILKNVRFFTKMRRYGGMLPAKYLLLYENDDLDKLVREDYLERTVLTAPGKPEFQGLRLGRAGKKLIDEAESPTVKDGALDIPIELLDIMEDVFHFSNIGRYRGMMPEKKAEAYESSDIDDLLAHGYVLKVKVKWAEGRKSEGYVLSHKAYRLLKSLNVI